MVALAKENGGIGRNGVAEVLQLLAVALLDELQIAVEVAELEGSQPATQPSIDQLALGVRQ